MGSCAGELGLQTFSSGTNNSIGKERAGLPSAQRVFPESTVLSPAQRVPRSRAVAVWFPFRERDGCVHTHTSRRLKVGARHGRLSSWAP